MSLEYRNSLFQTWCLENLTCLNFLRLLWFLPVVWYAVFSWRLSKVRPFFSSKFPLLKINQTLVLDDCDALIIEANEFNSSDY